jgi:hypothetical protein
MSSLPSLHGKPAGKCPRSVQPLCLMNLFAVEVCLGGRRARDTSVIVLMLAKAKGGIRCESRTLPGQIHARSWKCSTLVVFACPYL